MRLSYLCDCAGERMIGREIDKGTEARRLVMVEMTGVESFGCPWRSANAPIVREVLSAMRFEENGNLASYLPAPSQRLLEGIGFWKQVSNRVHSKQMELDREQRAAEARAKAAQNQVQRR